MSVLSLRRVPRVISAQSDKEPPMSPGGWGGVSELCLHPGFFSHLIPPRCARRLERFPS